MRLYKNVDITQIQSIMAHGILSIDDGAANDWELNKRVDNPTDRVYLFAPTSPVNYFQNYGIVLVEVEIPDEDATLETLEEYDANFGKYAEYTVKVVRPDQIARVCIPSFLRPVVEGLAPNGVEWVDAVASGYYGDSARHDLTDEELSEFAATAPMSTASFNFFRGVTARRLMIDISAIICSL